MNEKSLIVIPIGVDSTFESDLTGCGSSSFWQFPAFYPQVLRISKHFDAVRQDARKFRPIEAVRQNINQCSKNPATLTTCARSHETALQADWLIRILVSLRRGEELVPVLTHEVKHVGWMLSWGKVGNF